MNAETKHTPGPWHFGTMHGWMGMCVMRKPSNAYGPSGTVGDAPIAKVIDGAAHWENSYPVEANARLIAAAPEMAEALQAEEEADRLFAAADEYTHRAEGEGWLNDPTGSMHVTEAWDRARQAREHAKELRRAALLKAGG